MALTAIWVAEERVELKQKWEKHKDDLNRWEHMRVKLLWDIEGLKKEKADLLMEVSKP